MFSLHLTKRANASDMRPSATTPESGSRLRAVSRLAMAAAAVSIMAGCAATRVDPAVASEKQAQQIALSQQLQAAIERVNQQPRWSSSLDDKAAFASFNTNAVSVSYQGSAADLLNAVAASRGLSFKVTGPTPHIPIFVFVETEGQPFEEFLRDLDKQFGQRADVVWTDAAFELRYR